MPYIITTYNEQRDGVPMEDQTHADLDGTTRRAVAERAYSDNFAGSDYQAIYALPEAGGTIGPLPDGTVIEVEPLSWADLHARAGQPVGLSMLTPCEQDQRTIIDAYNAAQQA